MRTVVPALVLLGLAACGQGEEAAPAPQVDPATQQALSDQIMVDPDLVNENEGNAALTVSSDHSLPLLVATSEAIAAARADAAALAGGADKLAAMSPPGTFDAPGADALVTPAQFAASLPGAAKCVASLGYSAAWAARMPQDLPVYPRAATFDAAGSDTGDCEIRVATFVTPVSPDDVLSFYAARARASGFAIERAAGESGRLLLGKRGDAVFRLAVHSRGDRMTEATLATSGV